MRVLVLFGSKRGGTRGVAQTVAQALDQLGVQAEARPPQEVRSLGGYDAAIVGGALYAGRWPLRLRWFVRRHAAELRALPVWCFSSGPLDDSAERADLPPTPAVRRQMDLVRARGHATFGGRLAADARGLARPLAKTHAGDWRDADHVRAWASEVARELMSAGPRRPRAEPPAPRA